MLSDMDHTVLPANGTISAFTRKHFPGGHTTHVRLANALVQSTTSVSTPWGWMTELTMLADMQRMVYPEEVTCQLHVMAQAWESFLVTDQCSNHCCAMPSSSKRKVMSWWWCLERLKSGEVSRTFSCRKIYVKLARSKNTLVCFVLFLLSCMSASFHTDPISPCVVLAAAGQSHLAGWCKGSLNQVLVTSALFCVYICSFLQCSMLVASFFMLKFRLHYMDLSKMSYA